MNQLANCFPEIFKFSANKQGGFVFTNTALQLTHPDSVPLMATSSVSKVIQSTTSVNPQLLTGPRIRPQIVMLLP